MQKTKKTTENTQKKSRSKHALKKARKTVEVQKATAYDKSGGKIDAIKKKYRLTPELEQELKTL